MRVCELRDLGRMRWADAYALQERVVADRKSGAIPDQLLLVEHPHVVTMGRNAREANVLASPEMLERAGIALEVTNRGGDVTYHGPGQLVGYPVLDLKEWKRDVAEYVRALEQVIIDTLARFGLGGHREPGMTGVWTNAGKVAAIGVHLSRWVTSHGFALNIDTDLSYFRYIVPCGLTKPVTSMRALGCGASRAAVAAALAECFGVVFGVQVLEHLTLETR